MENTRGVQVEGCATRFGYLPLTTLRSASTEVVKMKGRVRGKRDQFRKEVPRDAVGGRGIVQEYQGNYSCCRFILNRILVK